MDYIKAHKNVNVCPVMIDAIWHVGRKSIGTAEFEVH